MSRILNPTTRQGAYVFAVALFGVLTIMRITSDDQASAWLNLITVILGVLAAVNTDWSNAWGILRGSIYSLAAAAFAVLTIYGLTTDEQTTAWLTLIQTLVPLLAAVNVKTQDGTAA